jgi:hypothetical protein
MRDSQKVIVASMREDAPRSDPAIAKITGVSHTTVEAVCKEVAKLATSPCTHGVTGQGTRNRPQGRLWRSSIG